MPKADTGVATETDRLVGVARRRSRLSQGYLPGQRAVRPLGQIICQMFFNLAFAWIRSNVSNPSLKELEIASSCWRKWPVFCLGYKS